MTRVFIFDDAGKEKLMDEYLRYAYDHYDHRLVYREENLLSFPYNMQYFFTTREVLEGKMPEGLQCDQCIVMESLNTDQLQDLLMELGIIESEELEEV